MCVCVCVCVCVDVIVCVCVHVCVSMSVDNVYQCKEKRSKQSLAGAAGLFNPVTNFPT